MQARKFMVGSLVLAALIGCGDRADYASAIDVIATLPRHDHVVYVESGRQLSHWIDPKTRGITTRPLRRGSAFAASRNGHPEEIVVLCRGRGDETTGADEPAALLVQSHAEERAYELGARFSELAQSDDGKFALLSFGNTLADEGVYNPNEIAIVDLDQAPSDDNPRFHTVRSLKGSFNQVYFSPAMNVVGGGTKPRLAVLLFDSVITLLDLDDSEIEFTLELSRKQSLSLRQVAFSPAEAQIYVRGDNANDLYVITLSRDSAGTAPYSPSLQQIEAGRGPRDFALYGTGAERRVVVAASGSREAVVIHADTSVTTSVPVEAAVDRVHLFSSRAPGDDSVADRALLYAANTASLSFLDLKDVEERGTRNLEQVALQAPLRELFPLDAERVLLLHTNSEVGLSVLSLEERTLTQIRGIAADLTPLLDEALGRLWFQTRGDHVAFLDLENLHPSELELNRGAKALFRVGDALIAPHDSPVGYLSILNAESPSAEAGVALRGFLVANIFDEGD